MIQKNPKNRRLNDDYTIEDIIILIHENNKKAYKYTEKKEILLNKGYKIFSGKLAKISWIWYKKSSLQSEDLINKIKQYNYSSLSILDLSNCESLLNDYIIVLSIIPISLLSYDKQSNNSSGIILYYSIFDNNDNEIKLNKNCKSIMYISESNLDYNIPLYHFYKERGIDIYNKDDKAFTEPCFQSNKFNWDLTQKYRKNNLYQNIIYKNESICKFLGIDYLNNIENNTFNALAKCEYNLDLNKSEIYLVNSNYNIENNNKIYNLPFKCYKKVKNIHKNIGFWLYLIIIILYITSFIINSIFNSSLDVLIKDVKNNKFIFSKPPKKENNNSVNENKTVSIKDINLNNLNNENNNDNNPNIKNNIYNENNVNEKNNLLITPQLKIENKDKENKNINEKTPNIKTITPKFFDFHSFLIDNLFSFHPLLRIIKCSKISPLMITQFIFLFNISTIFAFNAILLSEKRIERKIWDKERDKFIYPIKNEFGRIILSILISILFTVIIRAIIFISYINILKSDIILETNESENIENNKISNEKKLKNNHQIYIVLCVIMFLISIFYWYYTIVWCYVYYNSQFGWFYSGIWTLFWIWFIFAPIYILIISILQFNMKVNDICMYYLKNLTIF